MDDLRGREDCLITNENKYKEVWGVAPLEFGSDYLCPVQIGVSNACLIREGKPTDCGKCKSKFWHSAYKEPKKGE